VRPLIPLLLLAATGAGAVAQNAPTPQNPNSGIVTAAAPSTVQVPQIVDPPAPDLAFTFQPLLRRDALLGLARWDRTLQGAFQLGTGAIGLAADAISHAQLGGFRPNLRTQGILDRSVGAAPQFSMNTLAKSLHMDQLQRQGMNLRLNSAYGSFKMSYREVFQAHANGLGGGVGQASAAATYTTPRFGAMMDFSAAAMMGTGSINSFMGGGFGTNAIGGYAPGHKQGTAPTVAIKLSF
jgi:hypothetical protein